MAFSLYQTFNDLVVSKEDYAEAELFVQQYLNALYPTLDLREGSALRDIVLRPTATIVALTVKGVDKHFRENTISGVTDESPKEVVDAILSNFFVSRNNGENAQVVLEVRFSNSIPGTTVSVPQSATFSVDNVVKFSPVQDTTLSLTDGSLRLYSDGTGNQYYYGYVTVEAQDPGATTDLVAGQEVLFFTVFNAFFIGAAINSILTPGTNPETNTEFVTRAGNAISTRNLINTPSILTQIQDNFASVKSVTVSGFGDYEQFRDYAILTVPGSGNISKVHLGGYTDIYCQTNLLEKIVRLTFDGNGFCDIEFPHPVVAITPTVGVVATLNLDGSAVSSENPTFSYTDEQQLVIRDRQYTDFSETPFQNHTGFSSKQRIRVASSDTAFTEGTTVDASILYWDGLASVQAYVDNDSNRVVSASYLARGYNVVELLPTLEVIGGSPEAGTPEYEELVAEVTGSINTYISSLAPAQPFVFSDAIAQLTTDVTRAQFNSNIKVASRLYASRAGVINYAVSPNTGVIDSETIIFSSGHDETGTTRVAGTYVFFLRSSGVTLI